MRKFWLLWLPVHKISIVLLSIASKMLYRYATENKYCNGTITRNVVPGMQLFAEVLGTGQRLAGPDAPFQEVGEEVLLRCCLDDVPKTLTVWNTEFHLRGVLHHNPSGVSQGVGHYVAYCYRCDGTWQLFDDLRSKVINVQSTTAITPHGLIFNR